MQKGKKKGILVLNMKREEIRKFIKVNSNFSTWNMCIGKVIFENFTYIEAPREFHSILLRRLGSEEGGGALVSEEAPGVRPERFILSFFMSVWRVSFFCSFIVWE